MLDYIALFLLFFVVIVIFYGIIAIHDIPYEIAKSRNHPHQDAIHVSGWVSLFTLHILWPFLWIWAMLYRPDRGWGLNQEQSKKDISVRTLQREIISFQKKHRELEKKVYSLKNQLALIKKAKANKKTESKTQDSKDKE